MTNQNEKIDPTGAIDALNSIRDTRAQTLAKMNYWPWWYDLGYAAACAVLVGGQGFPLPVGPLSSALAIGILVVITRKWQAHTGVWVHGYAPKRARWAAIGLVVLLLGLAGLSIQFGQLKGIVWVPLVAAAIAAVLGLIGMRVWMRLYRKDMASLS